jgi:hypothetical protein
MAQPRKPVASLRAKGSHLLNPGRYSDRREPKTVPLGEPSPHLTGMARAAWFAFASEIPWLAESDRSILELACHIRGRLMSGEDVGANHLTLLRQCLSTMGATPADRSRVSTVPEEPNDDPASIFFNA